MLKQKVPNVEIALVDYRSLSIDDSLWNLRWALVNLPFRIIETDNSAGQRETTALAGRRVIFDLSFMALGEPRKTTPLLSVGISRTYVRVTSITA